MRAASPIPVTAGRFFRRFAPENHIIQFEVGLAPSSTPAALWMFPCVEYGARQKLCSAHCAGENRRIQFEAGLASRALPLLCGCFLVRNTPRGRSFVRRIAPEKPHNLIRGGPCPLEHPRCFIVACMEWEAQQKKRPPQSRGSGAGTVCLIRRETAAGTRAGCSSPPRTAKRHRRERACPCRSR